LFVIAAAISRKLHLRSLDPPDAHTNVGDAAVISHAHGDQRAQLPGFRWKVIVDCCV